MWIYTALNGSKYRLKDPNDTKVICVSKRPDFMSEIRSRFGAVRGAVGRAAAPCRGYSPHRRRPRFESRVGQPSHCHSPSLCLPLSCLSLLCAINKKAKSHQKKNLKLKKKKKYGPGCKKLHFSFKLMGYNNIGRCLLIN